MQAHAKVAIALIVVGILAIAGWRVLEPYLKASAQENISDAASLKATIRIAMDGWAGYFPLCSPEMKKRLRRDGYGLQCIDDAADYEDRFRKLDRNEYDFAVGTVDSYVLSGASFDFPGAIVAVIDESKGGDAIVANKSAIDSMEALKAAVDRKIAYTPASPSHHLVKSVAAHFDVAVFKAPELHYLANGSEDAFRALRQGEVDVAVLWEPDVSKALESDDFVRILGTEDTQQLIVDILIASRKVAQNDEAMILTLLNNYFRTLKFYADNQNIFLQDLSRYVDLNKSQVQSLVNGIAWANLNENAELWYGLQTQGFSRQALIGTIESAVEILVDSGDFKQNPLPNGDPLRLVASQYVEELHRVLGQSGGWTQAGAQASATGVVFEAMNGAQWENLQEVGSLKARKIAFSSGTANITGQGRQKVDELVKDLKHYPRFRIEVRGHSGLRGDADINLALSRDRAQAVLSYLLDAHEVDENRVRAVGFGGSRPLARKTNESNRAYGYRLPRVELVLVRETI